MEAEIIKIVSSLFHGPEDAVGTVFVFLNIFGYFKGRFMVILGIFWLLLLTSYFKSIEFRLHGFKITTRK